MVDEVPRYAAKHEPSLIARFMTFVSRLVLPLAALLAVYAWALSALATPITAFDVFPREEWYLNPGYWLTGGHLVMPLAFLVLNLANRRYGGGFTASLAVIAWAVAVGLAAGLWYERGAAGLQAALPVELPAARTMAAFIAAFALAQLICIFVFEMVRGRPWWRAPLYSILFAAFFFAIVFYPAAYIGVSEPWATRMTMHLGIIAVSAFVFLVPYHVLRGPIQPLAGYGGH